VSFLSELKRRNVFKVAAAYAIVGWLLVQIADVFFPALRLPDWTVTFVAALLILGLPVALLLSWAYELTPEGVKRTESVPVTDSITRITGRKLDFIIIGLLGVAVVYMFVDSYMPQSGPFAGATIDPASLSPTSPDTIGSAVEDTSATPAPTIPSIAALPFSNESAAAENAEFIANGSHDELLTLLAKIGSLDVIARTSVAGQL